MDTIPPNPFLWPPSYLVKKHPWARRIKFRASIHRGLEITVPSSFNLRRIPALLEKNRLWIEKQLLRLQDHRQSDIEAFLPTRLEFKALNKHWNVQYVAATTKLQLIMRPSEELVLLGPIEDKLACKKRLIDWIKKQAKIELIPQLELISATIGISYHKAIIRGQTTRWGSCTSKKSLSLNYKLLFFPAELVQHVMIHELCHTIQMNHSDKFWKLVAHHDANWRENRRALRKAGAYLPLWLG